MYRNEENTSNKLYFCMVSLFILSLILHASGCSHKNTSSSTAPHFAPVASMEDVVDLRKQRRFDEALVALDRVAKTNPDKALITREKARTFQAMHDNEHALELWGKIIGKDSMDREAILCKWKIQLEMDEQIKTPKSDTTESAKQIILTEIQKMLNENNPDRKEVLYLSYIGLGLIQADSSLVQKVVSEAVSRFPQSEVADEAAGNEFYDKLYPIWQNDSLKVIVLEKFLRKFPQNNWRKQAYEYLLHSLSEKNRVDRLFSCLEDWLGEDPFNPFAHHAAALYILKKKGDFRRALYHAREARKCYAAYKKSEFFPPVQWDMESKILFMGIFYHEAKALSELDSLDQAALVLEDALKKCPYAINDEQTVCAHYVLKGQVYEKKAKACDSATSGSNSLNEKYMNEAVRAYAHALVLGDSRGIYSASADSALKRILNTDDPAAEVRKLENYEGIWFKNQTKSAGLDGVKGTRVAWGDYDNDGFDDILVNGCVLFRNRGDRTFENVSEAAGLKGHAANGGIWADFNNDGLLDIFTMDREGLLKNNGDGTFTDVSENSGFVDNKVSTEGLGLGDYDRDGYVDVYVANYEVWDTIKSDSRPERHEFFKNMGNGTFLKVTEKAGIIPPFGKDKAGRGVNWGDYDNDGDLDIYVSNYRLQENFLWENQDDGSFKNVACHKGVAGEEVEGWWGHTIGSEWGDLDNDGDLDLVTANLAHPRYIDFSNMTHIYENLGLPDYKFRERRETSGIRFEETHSEPCLADFDGDGLLDLYLTSVYPGRRSFLYMNKGNFTFQDVTYLAGVRYLDGWGCACADYDNDGDQDLLVAGSSGLQLYENQASAPAWVEVKISPKSGSVIGSRITLRQGKRIIMREIQGGKGTTNQHSFTQYFGLGGNREPFLLEVRLPSGRKIMNSYASSKLNSIIVIDDIDKRP